MKAVDGLAGRFIVEPGKPFKLSKLDPDDTAGLEDKPRYAGVLQRNIRRLFRLQTLLAASEDYAILVILQAMDAGGKDGTIRHVMTGLNPQGCRVTSFKVPTPEESRHDFLWRVHKAVPKRGEIGIFNRSHYEDVLVARVHRIVPKRVWAARYESINDFEALLARNHVVILKFFLHISKEEQARRLAERIEKPHKNWKVSPSDIEERKFWDDYTEAYQDALAKCSTPHAPWYVIPANKKWFRNLAVAQILADTMAGLDMKYPKLSYDAHELIAALKSPA